jgi:hypothetical protein
MRWFRIRKAVVPESDRNTFERFGESVLGLILSSGYHPAPSVPELQTLYSDPTRGRNARDWLTEQFDRAERKETWSLTMEAAITVFVAFELTLSLLAAAGYEHALHFLFHR